MKGESINGSGVEGREERECVMASRSKCKGGQ